MKILSLSSKTGIAKIKVDSLDDLYYLSKLIELGDFLSGQTTRKVKLSKESERQKAEKRTLYLKIQVEKVDFDSDLRVHGAVAIGVEGVPLHSAHTIEVRPGSIIQLKKEMWRAYQVKALKRAESASVAPRAIICVLDDEEASFAYTTSSGIRHSGHLNLRLSKKRYKESQAPGKDIEKVAEEIIKKFKSSKVNTIIIGSPLFWKELVLKDIKSKSPELGKKVFLEDVSSGSKKGVQELINRGAIERVIKESQATREFKFVDALLGEISKNSGLTAYGIREVQQSINSSAVKTLLVTDKYFEKSRDKVKKSIDAVEQNRGEVHIIDSKNDPGKKLDGLGGVAALLRFKIK